MNMKMLNTSQRCKYQIHMEINSYQHDFLVRNFATQVLITLLNENDWSSQGKIAAVFENHPVKSAFKNIVLLRFSPNGLLALDVRHLTSSLLQICEMKNLKPFSKKEFLFPKENITETITCIGMPTGTVFMCSYPEMRIIHGFNYHSTDIVNIKYSIHNTRFITILNICDNLSILRNK